MAGFLAPYTAVRVTDSIADTKTATVTLPSGSWTLATVHIIASNAATTVRVNNSAGTAARTAIAAGATTPVSFDATDPTLTLTGSLQIVAGGGAGALTSVILDLIPNGAAVNAPTVVVA